MKLKNRSEFIRPFVHSDKTPFYVSTSKSPFVNSLLHNLFHC